MHLNTVSPATRHEMQHTNACLKRLTGFEEGVTAGLVRVEIVDGCLRTTRPARDVSGVTH